MAAAIRSTSSYVSTATETAPVVPVPAGVQNGDVLYMAVYLTASTGSITIPTGWTALYSNSVPTSSTSSHASLFRRVASSEPSSYTLTVSSGRVSASMVALTGVDTTVPEDVTAWQGDSTAGLTATVPSVAARQSSLYLSWRGGRVLGNGAVAVWAPDGGETERVDVGSAVSAVSNSSHTLVSQDVSAGATGGRLYHPLPRRRRIFLPARLTWQACRPLHSLLR